MGYMVSNRGIKPNPEKVQVIIDMPSPSCVKDIQRLTKKVMALHRFISKSAEKCLHFFKKLRKASAFEWTDEYEKAFQDLKEYL